MGHVTKRNKEDSYDKRNKRLVQERGKPGGRKRVVDRRERADIIKRRGRSRWA
jgi:hypothetical protein